MIKRLRRTLIAGIGIVLLSGLAAGCSAVDTLLAQLTPAPATRPPTKTPTPTRTLITFNPWTPTPEGYNYTQPAPTRTASATLRPTWTPLPSNTPIPSWTPSLTLSPTLTPSPTATLPVTRFLYETFSDPKAAWLQSSGANWETWIDPKGVYTMEVDGSNVEITSSRSWLRMAEVRMEADIAVNQGEGYYGFSCRDSGDTYYTLFIDSEGKFGLGRTVNGKVEYLLHAPSPAIVVGHGVYNHVVAECRGNTLTLYVNGVLLIRREIEKLGSGYAGMMAGTRWDQQYVLVHFDNFQVWGTQDFAIITNTPAPETATVEP